MTEIVYDWHGQAGVRCPTCLKWYPLPGDYYLYRSRGCSHCKGTIPYPPGPHR
jgi:hypothetical protein